MGDIELSTHPKGHLSSLSVSQTKIYNPITRAFISNLVSTTFFFIGTSQIDFVSGWREL